MDKSSQHDLDSIIRLFDSSDWKEIYVKTDSLEIFISDNPESRLVTRSLIGSEEVSKSEKTIEAKSIQKEVSVDESSEVEIPDGLVAVRAPNLGTFYRRPKPESPPYTDIGDDVTETSEVCLIEVMKLFTPVKAATSGKVVDILVADGEMVEFDQPLILINPS